ncbi:MAG: dimethylarginine dimethylaminohydrolase family protein [Cytophagaceae bacterium]
MISIARKVYTNEPDFNISEIPSRVEPRKVLMASPEYFDIIDVKNPHMEQGLGRVDKALAVKQWNELKKVYQTLKKKGVLEDVGVIPGVKGCEDMVFAANQTFPWKDENGNKVVVLSKMRHCSRQKEVPYFAEYFKSLDYNLIQLKHADLFEGMGDTIPHPGKMLLYGGYGFRSDKAAMDELSKILNVPIVALELVNDKFYHLDTCFLPLDEETVMICAEAFTINGIRMIKKLFKEVIVIPVNEAEVSFALNAHIINDAVTGKKFALIQKGNAITQHHLAKHGFEVIEVDTSEYIKSGGSVFCMKMMMY